MAKYSDKKEILLTLVYYVVTIVPFFLIIFNPEQLGWQWYIGLLLFYLLIFRPVVDYIRLRHLGRIEKRP